MLDRGDMFLVDEKTGERISLKGIKEISAEDISFSEDYPIEDIKNARRMMESVEATFTGIEKEQERLRAWMEIDLRKQNLVLAYHKLDIIKQMGTYAGEIDSLMKCILEELKMLGVDISEVM